VTPGGGELLARVAAELAVRRTIAAYCITCDDGRWDDFAACFAPDAVMELEGQEVARGRDAVRAWISKAMGDPASRGKHVTVNSLIDVDPAAGTGRATTDYLFVARRDRVTKVTTAGRYEDEFAAHPEGWLFARRTITFLA
jgi:3-phenylpropionate/cinnamic acid dioxygenase small subunit